MHIKKMYIFLKKKAIADKKDMYLYSFDNKKYFFVIINISLLVRNYILILLFQIQLFKTCICFQS